MTEIEAVVAEKIRSVARAVDDDFALSADTPLLKQQLLDSLELLQLVQELETAFSVQIPLEELTMDNFVDVAAVARLVERVGT